MAKKMTKAQAKRMYQSIISKSKKLWINQDGNFVGLSTPDMVAIEKICKKNLNRLK